MHFTFNNILVQNADFSVKIHRKYIKVLRHVSILTDHHQGLSLYAGGLDSISGQSVWNFYWRKWQCDRFSSQCCGFSLL